MASQTTFLQLAEKSSKGMRDKLKCGQVLRREVRVQHTSSGRLSISYTYVLMNEEFVLQEKGAEKGVDSRRRNL